MQVNSIQNTNQKMHPSFKMRIIPSESIKYAVLTSRNLMEHGFKEQNREFVREFCNSLVRILKSKKAEGIWANMSRGNGDGVAPCFIMEHYKVGKPKKVLWLDSISEKNHEFGGMLYSEEGVNIMRTIIAYAKTIKDVPEQYMRLADRKLKHFAYRMLGEDLHESTWGFNYPEAGLVKIRKNKK